MGKQNLESRITKEAYYFVNHHSTVRETAKHFHLSKTTIHNDLSKRLEAYHSPMASIVLNLLEKNKKERAMRGGMATRQKYLSLKEL